MDALGKYLLRAIAHYQMIPDYFDAETLMLRVHCPFHMDNTPSMSVYLGSGDYYCFGCSIKGTVTDLIEFLDNIHGCQILSMITRLPPVDMDAFTHLRGDSRVQSPDTNYQKFLQTLAPIHLGQQDYQYMLERGYTPETLRYFHVKSNPRSIFSVVVPLIEQHAVTGYVARRIDAADIADKYRYNIGLHKKITVAGNLFVGPVMLVEGTLDMMKAWQYGYKNTAALLGWHCSPQQAEKIRKYATMIICATDNDRAGNDGYRVIQQLFGTQVIRFPFPSHRKDIGEMTTGEFGQMTKKLRRNQFLPQESSLSLTI